MRRSWILRLRTGSGCPQGDLEDKPLPSVLALPGYGVPTLRRATPFARLQVIQSAASELVVVFGF